MPLATLDPSLLSRRSALGALAGSSASLVLSGCVSTVESFFDSCPRSDAERSDVNWIPDIAHPVSSGFVDVPAGDHRAMRIYYPTASRAMLDPDLGSARALSIRQPPPPILRVCGASWPIVLFLHGREIFSYELETLHRRFGRIGSTLARAGYVVAMPSHMGYNFFGEGDIAAARRDLAFVRSGWDRSHAVSKRPDFVVAGHSNGALQAAYLAQNMPEVAALGALSGQFNGYPGSVSAASQLKIPKLFMWTRDDSLERLNGTWGSFVGPTWHVDFSGDHFDYLEPADTENRPRGSCSHIGALAADLLALFTAANFVSLTRVSPDLAKPQVALTPLQSSYAQGYLVGQSLVQGASGCSVSLRWRAGEQEGCRNLGGGAPGPQCPAQ